jgi:hypothetical protein
MMSGEPTGQRTGGKTPSPLIWFKRNFDSRYILKNLPQKAGVE